MPRISKRFEPAFNPAVSLFGLDTTIPVGQLVHFINNLTFLNLIREEDLPVYSEKSELQYYKFFHYQDSDYRSDFCLLANSSSGIILFPTHRQFSYFLVIHGAIPDEKTTQLVSRLKAITGVQLAAIIKQETIKGLGPVLQDLEIHLTELKMKKNEDQKRIMPLSEDQ